MNNTTDLLLAAALGSALVLGVTMCTPARAAADAPDPLGGMAGAPCTDIAQSAGAVFVAAEACGFHIVSEPYKGLVQSCILNKPEGEMMTNLAIGISDFTRMVREMGKPRSCAMIRGFMDGVVSR